MKENLFFPDSQCTKCRDEEMEIAFIVICVSLITVVRTSIAIYFLANM